MKLRADKQLPLIITTQLPLRITETPPQAAARLDVLCRALARPYRAGRKILNLAVFQRTVIFGGKRDYAASPLRRRKPQRPKTRLRRWPAL